MLRPMERRWLRRFALSLGPAALLCAFGCNGAGSAPSEPPGTGKLSFLNSSNPATNPFPQSIAVADFNGDGKLDLAISLPDANAVQVLLGNGDATFTAMPAISVPGVFVVATGDFNGDGKADLVVVN